MSVLFVCFWVVLYALLKYSGLKWYLAYGIALIVMIRPLLFPQFTLTAGFLALSSVVSLVLFSKSQNLRFLLLAFILLLVGFFIREKETIFVLLVAMPMVPWGKILNRKIFYAVVLCFVASLGVCKSIHNEAYSGPEWNQFKEFQIVRSQLIDYRGLVYLKDRPDIHEKYGYSVNDLDMLRRWFFADQEVANTSKLQSMLDELGPLYD